MGKRSTATPALCSACKATVAACCAVEQGKEQQSMWSRLEDKMQGEAAMFSDKHVEALCQKRRQHSQAQVCLAGMG